MNTDIDVTRTVHYDFTLDAVTSVRLSQSADGEVSQASIELTSLYDHERRYVVTLSKAQFTRLAQMVEDFL